MQYNITYREKDGGWQYIISYKDSNGKWKQKSKQGFDKSRKGKQDAKDAAEKALTDLKNKLQIQTELSNEYDGITFIQFIDMFIKHESLYKEGNTIASYKTAFGNFTSLNNIEMNKIRSIDIQKCADILIKRGLEYITIKRYLNRLNTAFNSAKNKYKIITENPISKDIDLPKSKNRDEKRALTKNELDDLLCKIKNKKFRIISMLAGKCGLRMGEIIGLKWNDIDEKKGVLKVMHQWKKLKDGTCGLGELKSKNSNREVPIAPKVMSELIRYKSEFPLNYDGRIFNNRCNETLSSNLKETYKAAGYNISIHELRHTYATLLIANGVDFKTAAQLLGHDIEQTMKTYSHVTTDMIGTASKIINQIF